ncbi:MAG: hypothetical protein Q7K71_05000 [Candidatus Omnitrophota bacterium]|nr:hypothetical protein [Candidatus Omnitrophota bacterium]
MVYEKQTALKVAGAFFLLIAIVHFLRVIFGWGVIINGLMMPLWVSVIAGLITFTLSMWMFRSTR